jgi:anaerobic sulfite reductase subunit B
MTAAAIPVPYAVAGRQVETADTATLTLVPVDEAVPKPRPGQFMMLTAFGIGEVPISASGGADGTPELIHTVRAVGPVTRALHDAQHDAVIGVRGPFGTEWDVTDTDRRDLVFVAGGIGLAPLRPAIWAAIHSGRPRRIVVLVGARTPDDLLFDDDLAMWCRRPDVTLAVTVDRAEAGWRSDVGVVTMLLRRANFAPSQTTAFVCGPEVMMRVVARDLLDRGVPAGDVWLSLERNMRCGVGHCGHCQLGPLLLCRDGPVVRLDRATPLLATKEL